MKCVPLFWEENAKLAPLPTFVLRKKDVAVLLDLHSKNPRSQYWILSFKRERIYACDSFRAMIADCGEDEVDTPDEYHLPVAAIKAAIKGSTGKKSDPDSWSHKETTAVCIALDHTQIRVGTFETDRKTWDLYEGDALWEENLVFHTLVTPPTELGQAVPRMAQIDSAFPDLSEPDVQALGLRVQFLPEFMSTFGLLAKVTLGGPATMYVGGKGKPSVLKMDADDKDCNWTYILMPLVTK